MASYVRRRLEEVWPASKWTVGALIALALLFEAATLVVNGSKMSLALATIVAVGPLAVYLSLKRPLIMPFTLFVFCVPFNNLIRLAQFGTIAKLLGILSAAALALWLLRKKDVVKPGPTCYVWIAMALWMAASGLWAADATAWWGRLSTLLDLLFLYMLLSFAPVGEDDFRIILSVVIAGGILAAAYSIVVFYSGPGENRLWFRDASGNIVADPNHFATSLLLPIAIATAFGLRARWTWAKLGLFLSVALMMTSIYASGSRGALLGAAVMFVYFLWKSRRRLQLAVLMVIAALASLPFYDLLSSRLAVAWSSGGSGRFSIWKVALEAFKQHWLLGIGLGNFPIAYDESFIKVYQAVSTGWGRGPHDLIVSAAVELGIVGLALMLAAWFMQFSSLKNIEKQHPLYDTRVMLEAAIVAVFVGSLFLDTVYDKYVWLAFALMAMARSLFLRSVPTRNRKRVDSVTATATTFSAALQAQPDRGRRARIAT